MPDNKISSNHICDLSRNKIASGDFCCRPPSQRTRRNAKLQRTREEQEGRNGRKGSSAAAQPNKVPRGYVECPVCTMQLRETLVNDHIDK